MLVAIGILMIFSGYVTNKQRDTKIIPVMLKMLFAL